MSGSLTADITVSTIPIRDSSASGALRIVHAVSSQQFAGVERYICSVASGLAARGHEVVIIGGSPARVTAEAGPSVAHRPIRSLGGVARALIAERGCDVVHVHMTAAELALVAASPLMGSVRVTTRHFAARRGSSHPARIGARLIPKVIDCQIAISQFVEGRVEGRSVVLLNGVKSAPDEAIERSIGKRERIVLVAQRLEAEKETCVALRAFALADAAGQGWSLKVAGGGAQLDELKALARQLDIEHAVEFLGWVPSLEPWFDRASILLAPTRVEAFGLTVVEAMAAGLSVVAARGGAHLETIGLASPEAMFEPGNPDAAGALLSELAADPDRRAAMGKRAMAIQREQFDLDRHVDALEALYREVAAARGDWHRSRRSLLGLGRARASGRMESR